MKPAMPEAALRPGEELPRSADGSVRTRTSRPSSDLDVPRLAEAMHTARRDLEFYRDRRRHTAALTAGSNWAEEGVRQPQPVGLLWHYQTIVGRSLVPKNPRVLFSTTRRQDKPAVAAMQAWANRQADLMRMGELFRRGVVDALHSIGIVKVALTTPAESAGLAWATKAGVAMASLVSLNDFVADMRVHDFSHGSFQGHSFRVPYDAVLDSKVYSSTRKKLSPQTDRRYNESGDEKLSALGRGQSGGFTEEFEDMVTLWEVYLPRRRQVVTLASDESGHAIGDWEPLRVQEWVGPDSGPYHYLGYGIVPDNPMPLAPMMNLADLHQTVNACFRKLTRQADRLKKYGMVRDGSTEDGARIVEANDGDLIRVDDPQSYVPGRDGGPDNELFAFFLSCKDLFDYMAGGLAVLGGLGPQSKTATQDKMLNENAGAGVADLQETTTAWVSRVFQALAWFWWHDPFTTMRSTYQLPGAPDIAVERRVTPQQRMRSRWEDVDVKVDPYSLRFQTPQSRLADLRQLMQTVLLPAMPLMQQQGLMLDFQEYLRFESEYGDMPDLPSIVSMQEPVDVESGGSADPAAAPKPGMTERRYVRESVSGRTDQGNDKLLQNALMGVNSGGNPNGRPPSTGMMG